jgi:hypothetical protein
LGLAKPVLDLVGSQVAEEEAADGVEAEEDQPVDAVWKARLQPAVQGQQEEDQPEAEDHLVGDLGMNHRARLAEGVRVDVADAPGQVGRRAVVLPVDDVSDSADGEPDQGRQ